jgi:hypothetical protein
MEMCHTRSMHPYSSNRKKNVRNCPIASNRKPILTCSKDQSHIKKQTISQPFNFQHLSHTRRKHVPGLATVDEKGQSRIKTNIIPAVNTNSRPTTPLALGTGPQHSSSRSVDVMNGRNPMIQSGGRPRAASYQTGKSRERSPSSMGQVVRLSVNNPNIPVDSESIPPVEAQVKHCTPSEVKYRAQQPLPAIPQPAGSKRDSKRMTLDSQLSSSTSGDTSSIPDSRRSSQNVRSITTSPWITPHELGSTVDLSEASWEADVDFCYEQEAESTCDFHWDEHDEEMYGGFRISKFLPPNDGSRTSALFATSTHNTSPLQRRRTSTVGHRGFQHARTTSAIPEAPDGATCTHRSQEGLMSIKEDPKPMFGPEMHLSTSLGSISDSASTRTGRSGHHKSNSCASYESGTRLPAPSSDNGHSSIASLNSVPELVPSTTARSSAETIAVPQEPVPIAPRPARPCDIMRKPSTLSNRVILQAGRAVQRGRGSVSATGRMSRIPSSQRQLEEGEEATTWI